MNWKKQLWEKLMQGISHNGEGSEKRIVKMWVVGVLLALTICDWWYNGVDHIIWGMWFALITGDGVRASIEKKNLLKLTPDGQGIEKNKDNSSN
jgi:hypothetical protein